MAGTWFHWRPWKQCTYQASKLARWPCTHVPSWACRIGCTGSPARYAMGGSPYPLCQHSNPYPWAGVQDEGPHCHRPAASVKTYGEDKENWLCNQVHRRRGSYDQLCVARSIQQHCQSPGWRPGWWPCEGQLRGSTRIVPEVDVGNLSSNHLARGRWARRLPYVGKHSRLAATRVIAVQQNNCLRLRHGQPDRRLPRLLNRPYT